MIQIPIYHLTMPLTWTKLYNILVFKFVVYSFFLQSYEAFLFYKIHPFYLLSIIDQTYLFYLFLEASLTSPESSTTGLLNPIFVTPSAKNEDGGISNIAYATLILVVAIVSFLLCVTCCFCCKWTETFEVNFIFQIARKYFIFSIWYHHDTSKSFDFYRSIFETELTKLLFVLRSLQAFWI